MKKHDENNKECRKGEIINTKNGGYFAPCDCPEKGEREMQGDITTCSKHYEKDCRECFQPKEAGSCDSCKVNTRGGLMHCADIFGCPCHRSPEAEKCGIPECNHDKHFTSERLKELEKLSDQEMYEDCLPADAVKDWEKDLEDLAAINYNLYLAGSVRRADTGERWYYEDALKEIKAFIRTLLKEGYDKGFDRGFKYGAVWQDKKGAEAP